MRVGDYCASSCYSPGWATSVVIDDSADASPATLGVGSRTIKIVGIVSTSIMRELIVKDSLKFIYCVSGTRNCVAKI